MVVVPCGYDITVVSQRRHLQRLSCGPRCQCEENYVTLRARVREAGQAGGDLAIAAGAGRDNRHVDDKGKPSQGFAVLRTVAATMAAEETRLLANLIAVALSASRKEHGHSIVLQQKLAVAHLSASPTWRIAHGWGG